MGRDHIEWVFDDAKDTIVSRGEERDQADGERTIPRCVTAFNAITGHKLSNTDGWLFMEVLKKCRSVQGSYKYDDFRDGVGYAALRAEEARMEEEERLKPNDALLSAAEKYKAAVACGDLQVSDYQDDCQDGCTEHRTCRDIAEVTGYDGPCQTDIQRGNVQRLKEWRGGHGRPGQVVEICVHQYSNCSMCGITNDIVVVAGQFVPPECDNRVSGLDRTGGRGPYPDRRGDQ